MAPLKSPIYQKIPIAINTDHHDQDESGGPHSPFPARYYTEGDDHEKWSDITPAQDPTRAASRRRKRIWSALMSVRSLVDTALLLTILILVLRQQRSDTPAPAYELASDITGFAPKFTHQIKTFSPDPTFVPPNATDFYTEAVRQKWLSIVPRGLGYLRINDTSLYDNLPTPLEGYPESTFTTSVTHQLHCLHAILNVVAAYETGRMDMMPEEGAWHVAHCFDYLRQTIMCCGDVALEGQQTTFPATFQGSDGWDAKHVCRDYGQVLGYLEGRRVNDDVWI